jgi:beta-lactamase class A
MKIFLLLITLIYSTSSFCWQADLKKELREIDQNFEGEIGVVIKNLKDGSQLEYNAEKRWYLSSTIKAIVAISLMEEVEKGDINLDQKVTLALEHFVDGAGPVLWSKPGEQFTVGYLLKVMLQESDNTAADILMNLIGLKELNQDIKKWMPEAGMVTTLLEVRYLTYHELHPKARELTNMDYVLIKNEPLEKRHQAFARKIKVPVKSLRYSNLEEAQEKYYAQGYNSAKLQSYVVLLEKLEKGQLLSKKSTDIILKHMKNMKTGDDRIKAGLSPDLTFFQKTGTQIHRACNVGLIRESKEKSSKLAVAVCIVKPVESIDSDQVFKKIGSLTERLMDN